MGCPTNRRLTLAWISLYLLLSAWAMRWLWGADVAPGIDVGGHLTRLDAAWELFSSGHLDGWFDQVSVGYQMHLLYGPGFAFLVATLKLLCLGFLSTAGAYKLIGVLATVAIPFSGMALAKALGLKSNVAWLSGALMLAVSSPMSSGLEGAFYMGLMPQQVAAPMVLGAWALTIGPHHKPLLLGALVALITVTHPYSLAIYVFFGLFVLAVAYLRGAVIPWRSRVHAAVVALVLTAWWWIPAMVGRDLRGPLTGWANPAFLEHLRLVATGERGVAYPVSLIMLLTLIGLILVALYRKDLKLGALAVLPLVLMAALHLFVFYTKDFIYETTLFPNRGLTFAAYLAMPAVGLALTSIHRASIFIGLLATAIAVMSLGPPTLWHNKPNQSLEALATDLAQLVPPGYRFAFAELPMEASGVAAPSRYLGWRSGAADFTIFGSEWAPGSAVSALVYKQLSANDVDEWLMQLRQHRVSHVISSKPELSALFSRQHLLERVSVYENLELWTLETSPDLKVLAAAPNVFILELRGAATRGEKVSLPFGYSPGWSVEGYQLGRGTNGLLTFQANPVNQPTKGKISGEQPLVVKLEWRLPKVHILSWLVTLVGCMALAIYWARPSQVIERQTRHYPS